MESTGSARQTAIQHVKRRVNWVYKVGDKVLLDKKVSSAKQKQGMKKTLGLLVKFIRMKRSGFNAEPNQRDSILRRVTPYFEEHEN